MEECHSATVRGWTFRHPKGGPTMVMTEKQEAFLRKQIDVSLDSPEEACEDNPTACEKIEAVREAMEDLDDWLA